VRIKRENLLKQRPLRTNVSFGGERLGGLLSREKVQAAMQMMRPGDTVTLHDEACRWTLACAAPNAVSVRCTRPPRAAGGALLGLSATLRGDGMAVRGTALDAQTLGALAYMNNQMLPRREGCAAALGALRTGAAQGPPAAGAETAAGAGPGARAALRVGAAVPPAADTHARARGGIPCLFRSNNSGVVSRVAEALGAPVGCTVPDVARELYLAGLMCATAPKTETPLLVVGGAGCAVPIADSLAKAIYDTKPLASHVTVVLLGEAGPERVNCPLRKLPADSARQLAEALGPLGAGVRGECFVLSGPMRNNFALVAQPREGGREHAAAVSRGLAMAHA
jgi:hypothetical protein